MKAYAGDNDLLRLMNELENPFRKPLADLPALYRSSLNWYTTINGLKYDTEVSGDTAHVVVPNYDESRLSIMLKCINAPIGGHSGRKKTYLTVSRNFYQACQYQSVRKYILSCEVFQRLKPCP